MRRSLAKLENFIYLILLILFMFLVVYFNYQKLSGFEQKPKKFNIVEITQSKSVMDAINEAINLLEIPTEEIKITNGESAIYVRLGINGNRIDLNFANAIVTNQLDNIGAEVLSGEVRYQGSQQKLKIRDPKDDQIYSVILHYSKNYKKNKKK